VTGAPTAWVAVAAGLAACAVAGVAAPPLAIDWQPALAAREPWRAFTAIGVHYGSTHLLANLAGTALTAALGAAARMPLRLSFAWLAAWPLTQFGLLVRPDLAHYGGLSGVLHAGVAVVATFALLAGTGRQRLVGGLLLAGLAAKIAGEAPWGATLRPGLTGEVVVAPMAHLSGGIAGVVCAALALWRGQRSPRARDA
jgi:rhomboid family GlyGly-CTERM serine protease